MKPFNKEEIASILKRAEAQKVSKEVTINLGGPGFLLFIVFLVLKLTHTIDWSWWWVTCPIWIGPAFVIGVVAAILAVIAVLAIFVFVLVCFGVK